MSKLDMKFKLGDEVLLEADGEIKKGKIFVADYGGALGHTGHTYDVMFEDMNFLLKHIKESSLIEISD